MSMKAHQNSDPLKVEVGEIDTRAPFESVKAAVSLFGEVALSADKSASNLKKAKPTSAERILAKEMQLHLAQNKLNKLKEQLNISETAKTQALSELERAKNTVEELTQKIHAIYESNGLTLKATEAENTVTCHLEEINMNERPGNGVWKQELDSAREQCALVTTELNIAKQELRRIRSDFEAAMADTVSAADQEAEAKLLSGSYAEKAAQLSKDISAAQESVVLVKVSIEQAQQEEAKIIGDKAAIRDSYKHALEEAEKKLASLRKEFVPEVAVNLEAMLALATAEIGSLQKEIENAKTSDSALLASVTAELDGVKEVLQKVAEEKVTFEHLVESIKVELADVKKVHTELREKDAETESLVGNLHVKLQKCKADVEAAMAAESKATSASNELISTLQQLSSESGSAFREAEEMKKNADDLRSEAEAARLALDDAEKSLHVALKEAEEAKTAESKALDKIKELSEKANVIRASTSESGAKITISKEEFESLNRKVEESQKLADMKVAAAMAQVEAVKASENAAIKRLEISRKEMEDIDAATEDALKRAEMAEAAKRVVEGELRKWREREQKRTADAAAKIILTDNQQISVQSLPLTRPESAMSAVFEKSEGEQHDSIVPVPRKALLPNFSSLFRRKKSQVDGGSLSYLPGDKPVKGWHTVRAGQVRRWSFKGGSHASGVQIDELGLKSLTEDEELRTTSQVITRGNIIGSFMKRVHKH